MRDAGANPQPLDAGAIYIAGTLSEGSCSGFALADVFNPYVASTGFDCYFDGLSAMVRPTDGTLLYFNFSEDRLREYHCDNCNLTSASTPYPFTPLVNDPIIPTQCPGNDRFTGFLVSPDGEILHQCYASSNTWRAASGLVVFTATTTSPLLNLGPAGWGLTQTQILNWRNATSTPIIGLPTFPLVLATRWAGNDTFWMATWTVADVALWSINLSGVATQIGSYGPLPPNLSDARAARLDGAGRLFQTARDDNFSFRDVVVMRQVGGPSSIVYTEATNPLVKLHASSLVTGP